jgi:hypothetical protein
VSTLGVLAHLLCGLCGKAGLSCAVVACLTASMTRLPYYVFLLTLTCFPPLQSCNEFVSSTLCFHPLPLLGKPHLLGVLCGAVPWPPP